MPNRDRGVSRGRVLSTVDVRFVGAGVGMLLLVLASVLIGAQSALAQQSPSVQRGAHVFNDNCQICHGVYAQGRMAHRYCHYLRRSPRNRARRLYRN